MCPPGTEETAIDPKNWTTSYAVQWSDLASTWRASSTVKKRRRHTAVDKLRGALKAFEGSKTISQLSSEHEIHATLIRAWKRQLPENGPNVFCERLWRSVKDENINLNQYDSVRQLQAGLSDYFDFYNHERPHQSLNCRTPAEENFVL